MLYKVFFENNNPIGAKTITTGTVGHIETREENGRKIFKWMIVEAGSQQDALIKAKAATDK